MFMKRVIFFVAAIASIALGVWTYRYATTNTFSYADCMHTTFVRDASPDWTTVRFDDFSVDIPYSSEWDIEHGGCHWSGGSYNNAIYSVVARGNKQGESWQELAFGRPANNVSSSDSEYHLSHWPAIDMQFAPGNASCGRADVITPLTITVGSATGWQYFEGGAKWCEMVFAFQKDGASYVLTRNMEPTEAFVMDDEMKRIVESINSL